MKILHITDFHYSESAPRYDFDKIVDIIIESCKDESIDFVLFTGDLVYSGESAGAFNEARMILIEPIVNKLNINPKRVFLCAGNHDVYRGQELIDTAEAISNITNNNQLEDFIKKQNGKSFSESLKNLENYFKFEDDFFSNYAKSNPSERSPLYLNSYFEYQGTRIGIMSMNTAWRAIESEKDRGNLLFPISLLKEGITKLSKNTDFRILIHHHPISDFKDWNASDLEDLLSANFHMSFSGHMHKRKLSTQVTTDGGILSSSSAATLALDGTINGFSIIEIDLATYEGTADFRSFDRSNLSVMAQPRAINIAIPRGEQKEAAIQLTKTIRKRCIEEADRADELFIS